MKNNVGRPIRSTKLNSGMINDLKEYLMLGLDMKESCVVVGITPITFNKWRRRGAQEENGIFREFLEAVEPVLKEKEQAGNEKRRKITEAILHRLQHSGPMYVS